MSMTPEEAEEWFQRVFIDTGTISRMLKRQHQSAIKELENILETANPTEQETAELLQQINEIQQQETMRILKYGF